MKKKHVFLLCIATVVLSGVVSWFAVNKIGAIDKSAEFFIGLAVSILGLLITFVVGFQIYNALEARETIKEIGELKNLKREFDNFKYEIRAENENASGVIAYRYNDFILSVCHHVRGLYYSLKCDYEEVVVKTTNNALLSLSRCNGLSHSTLVDHKAPHEIALEYIKKIKDECGESRLYAKVKDKFEKIDNQLDDLIKKHAPK